jgi:hypothetical protein
MGKPAAESFKNCRLCIVKWIQIGFWGEVAEGCVTITVFWHLYEAISIILGDNTIYGAVILWGNVLKLWFTRCLPLDKGEIGTITTKL